MSSLVLSGNQAARRLLGADGTPEFTTHCGGRWIILAPARTWAEWRELAQAILDTDDPGGD